MPRKYTHIQEHEKEILELREEGMTLREIGETLGFSYKTIREFITRSNRRQRKLAAGIVPKPKGRPRKAEPDKFSMEYYKNRVKYAVIYRHREDHPVYRMCRFFGVSRSGYYSYVQRLSQPDPNQAIIDQIASQQKRCKNTYGYRRMQLWLDKNGCYKNPKTVLRLMKSHGLLSEIRRRRQWKQLEQQVHKYKNLLNREFHAERPNSKWVTDISYIHTEQGVLYLSMIRDLYDNSIVAYKTATSQTVNLVLDTIRLALRKEKVAGELQLHSDQGFQYTSHGYFKLTQSYGITPSMSRRGNPYDNAMAENFFSILKTECIYRQKLKTFQQANHLIDEYIHFYNYERLQTKTGLAPLSLRQASL